MYPARKILASTASRALHRYPEDIRSHGSDQHLFLLLDSDDTPLLGVAAAFANQEKGEDFLSLRN